jgi:hypothetical protein
MRRKGLFGLWMEMSISDFEEPPNEIAPCKFQAPVVPKPHSSFERYICKRTLKGSYRDAEPTIIRRVVEHRRSLTTIIHTGR